MADVAAQARALMRAAGQAALATTLARGSGGHPYVSLVLASVDQHACPVLLLSDLADHAKNLKQDTRAALLFEDAEIRHGARDPLTRPRVSVLGRLAEVEAGAACERLKDRFLARHPGAKTYAGFADFRLYRMAVDSAHLVAGFGEIHWMTGAEIMYPTAGAEALAQAEAKILERIGRDHEAALRSLAQGLGSGTGPVTPIGIDPEGLDLRVGDRLLRVPFASSVDNSKAAIKALVSLSISGRPETRED